MREYLTDPVSDFNTFFDDVSLWIDNDGTDGSDLVGVGLINRYNTCYMISALQVLFCTVPLVTKLKDVTCQKHTRGDGSDFCCLKALKELFILCIKSPSAVLPKEFLKNLSKISPNLQIGCHEDSHEFLLNLLEQIDKNCNDGADTDKQSLVREVFGIRSVLEDYCCNCRHLSATSDPMFFLTLPISGVSSLIDALQSYINIEERKGVKCEHCNESKRVTRTKIDHAPKVMSFQFNRYNNSLEKDSTAMEYPLELDLRPFIHNPISDEQTEYELYAVVDHMGCTTYGGHYLCFVRSSTTTWHEKNDHIVCKVTELEVLSKMPYMLFYVKKGTPWFATLDKSEFTFSPKSVLSPASSSVAEETPEKVDAINDKETHDSHDSEKYVLLEEALSTSHTYCDFETCVAHDDSQSTYKLYGLQENHMKRLNCDSLYPSFTYNDAPACQIQPQATKRQKGDGHVMAVEGVADDGNFEEDKDKENRRVPHLNEEGRNRSNKEASGSFLRPTKNASNIGLPIRNLLKDKPNNEKLQLPACMPQSSSGIRKSRFSSMSVPLNKKRQAWALETDPKFDVFLFKSDGPNGKKADTDPYNKSFSCKSISPSSVRRLF